MKRQQLFFGYRFGRYLAIYLISCLSLASLYSQGLHKIYEAGLIGFNVAELPNGNYRLVANSDLANYTGLALRHLILEIGADGSMIDSLDVNFQRRTFWLRDMTFLQPGRDFSFDDSTYAFIRSTAQHDTIWTRTVTVAPGADAVEWAFADIDSLGFLWVAGVWFDASSNDTRLILIKFRPDGEIVWQNMYQTTQSGQVIEEISPAFKFTHDHGCILRQSVFPQTQVLRFDSSGAIVWQTNLPTYSYNSDFTTSEDGRSLILGFLGMFCLDASGNTLFQYNLDSLGNYFHDGVSSIAAKDSGWIITDKVYVNSSRQFVLKLSASGELQWLRIYDFLANIRAGSETKNGELLWAGSGPSLIRMDSTGVIFKNYLTGRLAYDENTDCAVQPAEDGIPGWVIKLENNGAVQYTVSDPDGAYYFAQADTGQQILTPVVQNYLWQACTPSYTGTIPPDSSNYTLYLDAPIKSVFDCPVMTVDLAVPRLRRCFNNTYALQCCNYGNQAATDAYVEVYLPPHFLIQSASQNYTQDGLKVTFSLGTVGPFECRDIQMVVLPDCDSTVLGQSMCVSAHIWPDTICGAPPGWSGALIEVSAACDGDSVRFNIQNTGNAPTSQTLDFIVIDDHVMTLQGSFNLAAHASRTESFPADGSTWRLQAEQEPEAPGASMPSIAMEGCTAGAGAPFNTGYIIQWPNENGSPFWERDCHELVGSYDPNAKQAAPAGVNDPHWIKPNTPVEYLVEFQNTGTDTAFTVVLRDTLSPWLDPASVRPGAASHPYSWDLSGAGILTFRFDPIALPDSNTNEPASHGFVQFLVRQYPDLPEGTLLENRAGIYFDFNEPVITNTVFHTVGRDFLPTVGVVDPTAQFSPAFDLYPNPAVGSVFAFFKNENRSGGAFTLFDALGRVKWTGKANGASTEIRRNNLPDGVYWLRWEGDDGGVQLVKVVWH